MEFKWRFFTVAFVISLAVGALSNVSPFLFRMLDLTPESYAWTAFIIGVASFFVSPGLFFAAFYLMGRKTDLVVEFLSIVVPLFLGSWIGHLVGYFPLQFIYIVEYGSTFVGPWVLWLLWYVFSATFSREFFVGFAALSTAYIVAKRSP